MRGWVVVAEHPFYALTDPEGQFTLRGLAPGRYTVRVWQERLGTGSEDIVEGGPGPPPVPPGVAAPPPRGGAPGRRASPAARKPPPRGAVLAPPRGGLPR